MPTDTQMPVLSPKDFASDQDVRWCPGCGDYAILNQVRKVAAKVGLRRENTVFVSGIGCSSRFPYYMNTYGFHSIHGRAPALATGVKLANPNLDVWIVTGDGDGLSIGGNHLVHFLRRNINAKILLFNNRIYGLTKGQFSPTSEEGKKTKSSPMGSIDMPLSPLSIALASEASFVARAVDVDKNLADILERAARHRGSAIVEIYQDCNIFNHMAFEYATDRATKDDHIIVLEHGKPLVFGKQRDKGIRMTGDHKLEVVTLGSEYKEDDLVFHDEHDEKLAFSLSRMSHPEFPEPMGVFYSIQDQVYEDMLDKQVSDATAKYGEGTLESLFNAGDVYEVGANGAEPTHGRQADPHRHHHAPPPKPTGFNPWASSCAIRSAHARRAHPAPRPGPRRPPAPPLHAAAGARAPAGPHRARADRAAADPGPHHLRPRAGPAHARPGRLHPRGRRRAHRRRRPAADPPVRAARL